MYINILLTVNEFEIFHCIIYNAHYSDLFYSIVDFQNDIV